MASSPSVASVRDIDDAVKSAQASFGSSVSGFLSKSGLGQALGIKTKGQGGEATSGGGGGGGDALRRSGQSASWARAREVLVSHRGGEGMAGLAAKEVSKMAKQSDVILLDVRPKEDYAAYHASGSSNAQLYRYPDANDLRSAKSLVRQAAYMAQGVKPVEKNKSFVSEAKTLIGGANTVIVCCASGGTMVATENFPSGQESRSLLAAAELMSAGVDAKFFYLIGGLNKYFKEGLEGEGEGSSYDDKSGSVPFVEGFSIPQDNEELMD
ncbi:rhodanese domain-containing protein [Chloropicon primus]|nr:rhodanese domain-containing protein [Chloropicon primus]